MAGKRWPSARTESSWRPRRGGAVRFWEVETGARRGALLQHGPDVVVDGVAFSPDGKLLATTTHGGAIRLWEVATGRDIRGPLTEEGKNTTQYRGSLCFNTDGTLLAA